MKIYFIRLENTIFGGAEQYLSRLTEALQHKNIDYEIIHGTAPKLLASWIKALWLSVQVSLTKDHKFYFSLARITCPDIYRAGDGVHRQFMRALNKKFWQNPIHLTYCFLEKKCFKNAKLIIANSHMIKQEIINTYAIKAEKIRVIYNGINPTEFDVSAAKAKLSKEFNIPSTKKIILLVGSGFERKGVSNFLDILAQLKSDFQAIVVGKEKQLGWYKEKAQKLRLESKVIFTGLRSDVVDFYAASDIFILPALYEPFPNVALEAMSCDNAVFCSRHTGAAELLQPEFIIQNSEQTARKVDELLSDENKLLQAKSACRSIAAQYSIEKNVEETLAAIQSCGLG